MKIAGQHAKGSSKFQGQRRYLSWILLAITVLAIVVPVTIRFSKMSKSAPPKSTVLLPLYVYPAPGAWEPLFTACATNTSPSQMMPQLTTLTASPATQTSTSPSWSIRPADQAQGLDLTPTIRGRFPDSMHTPTCELSGTSRPPTPRGISVRSCRISALTRHGLGIAPSLDWECRVSFWMRRPPNTIVPTHSSSRLLLQQ